MVKGRTCAGYWLVAVKVNDTDLFFKFFCPKDNIALRISDKRSAIKNQLILPADLININQRDLGGFNLLANNGFALMDFSGIKRRGIEG